jgi:hypothetical protein
MMSLVEHSENRELTDTELNEAAGGMRFFGMGCSVNQNNAIGAIVDGLGSIPVVGGVLAGIGTAIGRAVCS